MIFFMLLKSVLSSCAFIWKVSEFLLFSSTELMLSSWKSTKGSLCFGPFLEATLASSLQLKSRSLSACETSKLICFSHISP